jgi:tripartite-type tricarboxylate transporter receptor subunit TctC
MPFGGGGPMVQSVVAGHTPIAFSSLAPAAALIDAGKIRALAVTSEKRVNSLPDVPTMAEAGYPDQLGETPIGIFVPDGTPKTVGDLLHRKTADIIKQDDVKQKLATIGFSPIGDTPAEFTAFLKQEGVKWAKVIEDAGIKLP